MKEVEYKYVDTATGGVDNRNNIRLATDKLTGTDVYKTYFRYPEEFMKHFKIKNSVKGYDGSAYADWFPIDIDKKDDLNGALELLREVLTTLEVRHDVVIGELPIFFSGAKGFHIYIPAEMIGISPSPYISQYFKQFATELLAPMNVKYDATIYDIVRLFRVNNTKNSKSGLYKIALSMTDVFQPIEHILEMAKNPRAFTFITDFVQNESLSALYKSVQERPVVSGNVTKIGEQSRFVKLCYQKMLEGTNEGNRDNIAFRVAGHFKKQGLPSDLTESLMLTWNKKNNPPLSDRDIFDKVRSAYNGGADYGCNDDIVRSFCNPACYLFTKEKTEEPTVRDIYSFDQSEKEYTTYVHEAPKSRIFLPIPIIGKMMRGIAPGEALYMIARAGVGKTAGILNLFQWIARSNHEPFLFFSMEQPVAQVYERMAQIATGLSGSEIEAQIRLGGEKAKYIRDVTRSSFKNMNIVDRSGMTVNEIANTIKALEVERKGNKVRLIGIDYMGLLSGKGKDRYQQVSDQARDLQRMMKDVKVAGIVLAQINRAGGDGSEPVTMDMIRDSGSVEEVATHIIGIYRKSKDQQDTLRLALLKNKHGAANVTYDYEFLKPSLRFENNIEPMWNDNIQYAEQFGQEVQI